MFFVRNSTLLHMKHGRQLSHQHLRPEIFSNLLPLCVEHKQQKSRSMSKHFTSFGYCLIMVPKEHKQNVIVSRHAMKLSRVELRAKLLFATLVVIKIHKHGESKKFIYNCNWKQHQHKGSVECGSRSEARVHRCTLTSSIVWC